MTTIESILVNFLESYMQDCMVCLPAVVLNVRDAGELRVDCQPISNREFKDGTVAEYPAILSIPVIQPSSGNSAVLMPIKQGDTVLLVFAQRNIDTFKAGSTLPYDPEDRRWMNLQDAVAIAGINPFNRSPNLPSRHKLPHSTEDMVVVHNLGTDRECEFRLKPTGSIAVTANNVDFNCKTLNVSGQVNFDKSLRVGDAATGTLVDKNGQIIQVSNGIITNIL